MAICSGSLMFQKSFKYWEHNTSSSPLLLGLMAVRDDIWTQMSLSSEEYNLKKTKGMWLQRVSYSVISEHCFTERERRGGRCILCYVSRNVIFTIMWSRHFDCFTLQIQSPIINILWCVAGWFYGNLTHQTPFNLGMKLQTLSNTISWQVADVIGRFCKTTD